MSSTEERRWRRHWKRKMSAVLVALAILALAAWLLRDPHNPYEVVVGQAAAERLATYPWYDTATRLRIIDEPDDALMTRLQLINEARDSVDLATFIYDDDSSGHVVFEALRRAAERGVRVRILGDGVFFMRIPERLREMVEAHELIELRLYNPIDQQATSIDPASVDDLLVDFDTVNQRLHLKLLLVDQRWVLTGGRNIANAYFGLDAEMNFIDRDVLVDGTVHEAAAQIFERFWLSDHSVPVLDLDDVAAVAASSTWTTTSPAIEFDQARIGQHWQTAGRLALWADPPSILGYEAGYQPNVLANRLMALLGTAQERLLLQTPYFVLSPRTRALFDELQAQRPEVEVSVLSNSLASTDNWQTFMAFQAQLRDILEVHRLQVFLKKPMALAQRAGKPEVTACLHAKTLLVDDRYVGIGSFNLDPRSELYNPEIMLIIDDPEVVAGIADQLQSLAAAENSWVLAKTKMPLGVAQLDELGAAVFKSLENVPGIQHWPLNNAALFEKTGERRSPYAEDFYEHYRSVGLYPGVPVSDRSRILTYLFRPLSNTLEPIL